MRAACDASGVDDDFEPRLGRMRAGGSRRDRKYLYAAIAATARAGGVRRRSPRRFDGSRIARGTAIARLLATRDGPRGLRARRAVVKTRLVRLAGKGLAAARAHLRYVQRDGVSAAGERGQLYSALGDEADGTAFLERCSGDRHQFRFIVSAEDGADYDDLRPLIRRLMLRMEEDLGTGLDWVAADHRDTLHPHTHILLRGKDDRGQNLVIAPDYIARGMRERVADLVALDLGPRSHLEIARRLRLEVEAERLTSIDRRLLREMSPGRTVDLHRASDMADRALRVGRLRKLEQLGLAEKLGGGRWRLDGELDATLRQLGERNDIIRSLQRALTAARLERAPCDQRIHERPDPGLDIVGRLVARGLSDELRDRHYLIVDGIDGRSHFIAIGKASAVEPLPGGAIVRITARSGGVRPADQTIADVAGAHQGLYSVEHHLTHDPDASEDFARAHVRRLEALRRDQQRIERDPDGRWAIPADFLALAAAHEARLRRDSPVAVELLSAVPLERLATAEGATWLDRELLADPPALSRDAGFGRELRSALTARRAWLIDHALVEEADGQVRYRRNMLAVLQRRELLRVAGEIAEQTGRAFVEPAAGTRIDGVVRRRLDLASGRFALIENSREFSLVPWRPVLDRAVDKAVTGTVREGGISWTIARDRDLAR